MENFVSQFISLFKRSRKQEGQREASVTVVAVPGRTAKQTERLIHSLQEGSLYSATDIIRANSEKAADLNHAVSQAQGDYIVFLAGNTEVKEQWLDKLLIAMTSEKNAGAVGMTGLYPANNKKGKPEGAVREQGVDFREKQGKQRIWMEPYSIDGDGAEDDSGICPCPCAGQYAFIVQKQLFNNAGGFDEQLLANEAFLDFQLRLQLFGYQNYCSRDSKIYVYGAPKEQDAAMQKLRNDSRYMFRCRWQKYLSSQGKLPKTNAMEIDICGAMPEDETKKFWGDWHYAAALQTALEQRGYKVNVLTREHWYDTTFAATVLVLRGVKKYYPSAAGESKFIMWNISHPDAVSVEEYNMYDYVFFASDKLHQKLAAEIKPQSGVLLQCVDPSVMSKVEDNIEDGKELLQGEKGPELLFVGNSRHVYRQILKDLLPTKHELHVYGRHWEEFPVQEYVVEDYLDNAKVGQAYHGAEILLNDHWADMRENGIISNRIFDALAAGGFVISDDMPEIQALFQGAVVTYQNREDLAEKIDYYLSHKEERRRKAGQGQEIVLKAHTFANRAEQIAEVIEQIDGSGADQG